MFRIIMIFFILTIIAYGLGFLGVIDLSLRFGAIMLALFFVSAFISAIAFVVIDKKPPSLR